MRNKPPYAIASVDAALALAALLRQEGPMRVTDVAERLAVSASTAHRLLATLVYRDFAEQQADRRYRAGRIWQAGAGTDVPVARLRETALPLLRSLADRVGETANVMVLVGADVRFVATAECDRVLRVGDRTGRSLPARLTSGGQAVLATLPPEEVGRVLAAEHHDDLVRLRKKLALVRRRGFAVNDQGTEVGVSAVGVALPDPSGTLRAALSLAVPRARFSRAQLPGWAAALEAAAVSISSELAGTRAGR